MTIEGDAVSAIATLLSQIFGWLIDPDGYAKLQTNTKLDILRGAIREAANNKNLPAIDRLLDEYRRLHQEHTAA